MPKHVQLPDGSVGEFPDSMDDSAIESVLQKQYAAPKPDASGGIGASLMDFGKGILKGGIHTMSAADDFAAKHLPAFMTTPIGQAPTAENSARAVQAAKDMATPHNTAQSIGRGLEQAGEFLIPGGAEKALVGGGGGLMRAGAAALGSGAVNAMQGGSFLGGAAAGGIGSGIATGLSKIAAPIAEKAMGIRGTDRAFGRTPGQAILDETTGVRPGTIARQAESVTNDLTGQVESHLANAPDGSLLPARNVANSYLDTATSRNVPESIKRTGAVRDLLTRKLGSDGKPLIEPILEKPPVGGLPTSQTSTFSSLPNATSAARKVGMQEMQIPETVPATTLLNLKRGVGELAGSWNPAVKNKLSDSATGSVYHALDSEMDRLAPATAGLNSRISSLIPVANRAGATDLNENLIARTIGRFGKPTGALVGTGLGAAEGRREGGTPGMIAGGLAGLIAPEVLASPTTMMVGSRLMASPNVGQFAMPALTGLGLQGTRKRKEDEQ